MMNPILSFSFVSFAIIWFFTVVSRVNIRYPAVLFFDDDDSAITLTSMVSSSMVVEDSTVRFATMLSFCFRTTSSGVTWHVRVPGHET